MRKPLINCLRKFVTHIRACIAKLIGMSMNNTVSPLLYKYRRFDTYALRILAAKELYFAAPETLNDPLDCQLPIRDFLNQVIESEGDINIRDLLVKLRDLNVTNRTTGEDEVLHHAFEKIVNTVGVLSLSSNPTDALLWSHYADGHRGFCIGFDASYFDDLIDNCWQQLGLIGGSPVSYVDAPPFRDLWLQKAKEVESIIHGSFAEDKKKAAISLFSERYNHDVLVAALSTKSENWKYEHEYRAVKEQPGTVAFPPSAIREIIFGLKSSEADQLTVKTLLDGPEWKHVRFRRPSHIAGTFSLELLDC